MFGKAGEQHIPAVIAGWVRRIFEQPPTGPAGSWWYSLRNSTTSRHCESKSGSAATKRARPARVIGW
jgi:hypothetical protein